MYSIYFGLLSLFCVSLSLPELEFTIGAILTYHVLWYSISSPKNWVGEHVPPPPPVATPMIPVLHHLVCHTSSWWYILHSPVDWAATEAKDVAHGFLLPHGRMQNWCCSLWWKYKEELIFWKACCHRTYLALFWWVLGGVAHPTGEPISTSHSQPFPTPRLLVLVLVEKYWMR